MKRNRISNLVCSALSPAAKCLHADITALRPSQPITLMLCCVSLSFSLSGLLILMSHTIWLCSDDWKKIQSIKCRKGKWRRERKKIWFTLPLVFVQLVGKKEKRRKRERKTRRGWRVESQRLLCIRVMKRVEAAEPLHVQNRWLLSDKHVPISLANKITFYLILSAENQSENWVSNSPLGTV